MPRHNFPPRSKKKAQKGKGGKRRAGWHTGANSTQVRAWLKDPLPVVDPTVDPTGAVPARILREGDPPRAEAL